MNTYAIWVDLAPGAKDMEFSDAVKAYLDWFVHQGLAQSWRLERRKFGFGPAGLGEWMILIEFSDLAQMDRAFSAAAARRGEAEALHAAVYSRAAGFQAGLYRSFPDPERTA